MNDVIVTILSAVATVLGAVGGWEAIKYFINRKTNARKAEAEADSDDFHVLRETIEFLQLQLKQKEERFAEQTAIVRRQSDEILGLTKTKGALELELQKYKCIRAKCANREPQNGY